MLINFDEADLTEYNLKKYVIKDNIINEEFAKLCQNEILNSNSSLWDRYNNYCEQKYTFKDKNNFPENTNKIFEYLVSDEFVTELNKLTGLKLITDTNKLFYGIHMFENGDYLDIHVDAGRHFNNNLIKAVTLGIYLSYNWTEENKGYLEFWEGDKSSDDNPKIYFCKEKILPKFNRLVVFECHDKSWHGSVEKCIVNSDEKRIFLTVSYLCDNFTDTNFTNNRYKALFVKLPDEPENEEKDKFRLMRSKISQVNKCYNLSNNS
jgi:Rps23 Pro-64 3,4-dihydroxylase Tpa1-like proline 4-hydroxylase